MKKFTLQLQNINGEVMQEKEMVIGDNDLLIMQYPESVTLAQASKAFEILQNALETGGLAGLPSDITFTVVKKLV